MKTVAISIALVAILVGSVALLCFGLKEKVSGSRPAVAEATFPEVALSLNPSEDPRSPAYGSTDREPLHTLPKPPEPETIPLDQEQWQILADQTFSSGLSLTQISDQLFALIKDAKLDPASAEAEGQGELTYHFIGIDAKFTLRGENGFEVRYYLTPKGEMVVDGVERSRISFALFLDGDLYGFGVQAHTGNMNPNACDAIMYGHPETGPHCVKSYPPWSTRADEIYPLLGPVELSEPQLEAWNKKIESLALQVKPK